VSASRAALAAAAAYGSVMSGVSASLSAMGCYPAEQAR